MNDGSNVKMCITSIMNDGSNVKMCITSIMNDGSNVGLVNAHPEGDSGHNTLELIPQKLVVNSPSCAGGQTGMVPVAPHPRIWWIVGPMGHEPQTN